MPGSAAAVAREINTKQSFLRTRFQPDTQGGQPYLFPERTIILKGGVTPAQIAELGLGVTLFLALAKALITMGLEPEVMDRTVLPTPAVLEAAE